MFNDSKNVEATINSVLNQTYARIEYIVVDGASTDGTSEICARYLDKISIFLCEVDDGIYDAMNKAISVATGDYIVFMNSGDLFFSEKVLDNLVPRAISEISNVHVFATEHRYEGFSKLCLPSKKMPTFGMPFCHQSVLIPAALHKKFPYLEKYKIAADFYFFLSLFVGSKAVFRYSDEVFSSILTGGVSFTDRFAVIKEYRAIHLELGAMSAVRRDFSYLISILGLFIKNTAKTLVGSNNTLLITNALKR